jgi:hypothetical protein
LLFNGRNPPKATTTFTARTPRRWCSLKNHRLPVATRAPGPIFATAPQHQVFAPNHGRLLLLGAGHCCIPLLLLRSNSSSAFRRFVFLARTPVLTQFPVQQTTPPEAVCSTRLAGPPSWGGWKSTCPSTPPGGHQLSFLVTPFGQSLDPAPPVSPTTGTPLPCSVPVALPRGMRASTPTQGTLPVCSL